MSPVAITDIPAALQRTRSEAVRWTWPVTAVLADLVWDCVASAYNMWGTAEHQADLLADLAVEFVTTVLNATPGPYIVVTAVCEGSRATISVIPWRHPHRPSSCACPTET